MYNMTKIINDFPDSHYSSNLFLGNLQQLKWQNAV